VDIESPYQIPITPEDDDWHGGYSNHWWETETNWWSWNVPNRNMGGWIHHAGRVNQHNLTGGCWTWDDSDQPALYEKRYTVPYERSSLREKQSFATGFTLEVLEPLMKYRTIWSDPGELEVDLVHEGIMAPHSHPEGAMPFYQSRHFDQAMKVTGTVVLSGEEIPVNCYSVRDRSWGPRPGGPVPPEGRLPEGVRPSFKRGRPAKPGAGIGYVFATQDSREAFMAFTAPWMDADGKASDDVSAGYLVRDDVYAPLVSGSRVITLDPDTLFINTIHLEATDSLERELIADGTLRAHHGSRGPGGTGMFYWTWSGGCAGYVEDQSGGAAGVMAALNTAK
jgi:hypothetical protein